MLKQVLLSKSKKFSFLFFYLWLTDDKTADIVFVHLGTNDIGRVCDGQPIMDVIQEHLALIKPVMGQYSCLVLASLLLPRIDE